MPLAEWAIQFLSAICGLVSPSSCSASGRPSAGSGDRAIAGVIVAVLMMRRLSRSVPEIEWSSFVVPIGDISEDESMGRLLPTTLVGRYPLVGSSTEVVGSC
jgi:hypothetical protein